MSEPGSPPGCFGKLPCAGDFLRRRVPDEFVLPWDDWLQQGLVDARQRLGDRFSEMFLTFSVWHFLLPPGAADADAWIGVMMPSNDRVGRLFPMTIVEPLAPVELARQQPGAMESRLDELSKLGLAALELAEVSALDPLLGSAGRTVDEADAVEPAGVGADASIDCGSAQGLWRFEEGIDSYIARSGKAAIISSLDRSMLWWLPPDAAGPGILLREPLPLRPDLLHDLIMPGPSPELDHEPL